MKFGKILNGFEGNYQVSNKSIIRNKQGQIMKTHINSFGYEVVCFYKERKNKWCKVHRLVAEAFIPNPENKPQVNHINGDKTDNRIENLEWVTASENMKHAFSHNLCENTREAVRNRMLNKWRGCK